MIATTLLALALTTTGTPGPDRTPVDAVTAIGAAAASAPKPAKAAKPTLYCVEQVYTGSRIPIKTCRTRTEWMALGFDPLSPN